MRRSRRRLVVVAAQECFDTGKPVTHVEGIRNLALLAVTDAVDPGGNLFATTSRTAAARRVSNASGSNARPLSRASRYANRAGGRGRLPTCVVRMRSLLSFIGEDLGFI
jgi:hypothetical protein